MDSDKSIICLPLGGAGEIGASSFYIRIGNTGLLLDAGLHPRKSGDNFLPKFELLSSLPLDFVFISHAHQDHIGALPFLVKKYPHVKIFCTEPTKDLAKLVLHNSLNILKKEIPSGNEITSFTHQEIDLLVSSMRDVSYNVKINLQSIADPQNLIEVEFIDAGHVLGSASIFIQSGKIKMLYTGDVNTSMQTIMNGGNFRRMQLDLLILESTYGSTASSEVPSWEDEKVRFAEALNKILNRGGSVLIPVFALGKFQEIIALLNDLMESGKIVRTEIFTHGLGKSIAQVYDKYSYTVKRNKPDLKLKEIPQTNLTTLKNLMHLRDHPGIVLASSGMLLKNTLSYDLAKFFLRMKEFAIFSVGYMDPETPGFWIMNKSKGELIELGSEKIKVRCEIQKFTFRSHSKRSELIELVKMTNPTSVHLIHGDQRAIENLGFKILTELPHIKLSAAETEVEKIF